MKSAFRLGGKPVAQFVGGERPDDQDAEVAEHQMPEIVVGAENSKYEQAAESAQGHARERRPAGFGYPSGAEDSDGKDDGEKRVDGAEGEAHGGGGEEAVVVVLV